ncbi:unnamed protein product [Cunninghamella echinulata]
MNEPSDELNINKLPGELIEYIFSFLSQRYLHRASTVCKKWLQITRQPKFYKSVELYSTSQIEKFIEVIINDTPLSLYIKEITFYNQFIHNLNPYILVVLINLCPFVTQVENIPDIGQENYKELLHTNYWRQLKELPLSYTKMDKRWMDHMKRTSSSSNNKYKVTSLSIDLSQYIALSIEDYSNIATDDERNYKLLVIEHQRNCELPRRYNDINRREGSIVSFSSYYFKLPSSLVNLKELYLDFETYNKKNNLCYYEFNETTLDSISISCPSLTHLTLFKFNLNISNTFLNQLDSSSSSTTIVNGINPSPQLKYLRLRFCYLHDPDCYTYIQYKYPNLTTLHLMLTYFPEMNTHFTEYKSTIGNLVTSYDDSLTGLQVQYVSDDIQNVNEQKYWPHTKLLTWLMTHPNQLTTFKYPFDLFTIEREDNDWETALAIEKSLTDEQQSQLLPQYRSYLQNLKVLELKFELIPENTLQYLLYQNPSEPKIQSSLCHNVEHLYVYAYFYLKYYYQNKERQFFIYDWLSAFSGLKILEINNLWIIHDYQLVDPHQNWQQRFSTINETTYRLNPCYQLTELRLKYCRICLDLSEMTQLLESLINLQSLYIDDAWFTARTVYKSFIVSAPHLNLCNLQLSHLKFDQLQFCIGNRYREFPEYERYYIQNIEVKEISSNNSIKTQNISKDGSLRASNIVFNFVCNSVDNFWP